MTVSVGLSLPRSRGSAPLSTFPDAPCIARLLHPNENTSHPHPSGRTVLLGPFWGVFPGSRAHAGGIRLTSPGSPPQNLGAVSHTAGSSPAPCSPEVRPVLMASSSEGRAWAPFESPVLRVAWKCLLGGREGNQKAHLICPLLSRLASYAACCFTSKNCCFYLSFGCFVW